MSGLVPITHLLVGTIIIVSSPHLLYIYFLVVLICLVAFIVIALGPTIQLLSLCCSPSDIFLVFCLSNLYFDLIGVLALGSIIIDILWVQFKSTHNYFTGDVSLISSSVILFMSFLPWSSLIGSVLLISSISYSLWWTVNVIGNIPSLLPKKGTK